MWSLRPGSDAEFDKYLVQAFTSGTFIIFFHAATACSDIALTAVPAYTKNSLINLMTVCQCEDMFTHAKADKLMLTCTLWHKH
jgi:hypothetical protein